MSLPLFFSFSLLVVGFGSFFFWLSIAPLCKIERNLLGEIEEEKSRINECSNKDRRAIQSDNQTIIDFEYESDGVTHETMWSCERFDS